VDPPDPTQMMERPRKAHSGLLGKREFAGIAVVGLWMGGTALACDLWPWRPGDPQLMFRARAIAFSLLALSPLFHAFNCRSPEVSAFAMRPLVSKPLLLAVALSAGIHLVAVLVPGLRPIFRTFGMDAREWEILLLLSASIVPAIEVLKLLQRWLVPIAPPSAQGLARPGGDV
jgi:Ca2+-transporting ATPase